MHKQCSLSSLFLTLWLKSGLHTYIWHRNLVLSYTLNWFFYGVATGGVVSQAWDHTYDLLHDRPRGPELDVGISPGSHSLLSNHLLFYVRKPSLSLQLDHLGILWKMRYRVRFIRRIEIPEMALVGFYLLPGSVWPFGEWVSQHREESCQTIDWVGLNMSVLSWR